VIRLGDFSPFGQLFTLGNFLKISEGLLNFGLLFLQLVHVIYVITWTKQRLGQIFVDFFYKHGHPDPMIPRATSLPIPWWNSNLQPISFNLLCTRPCRQCFVRHHLLSAVGIKARGQSLRLD
jgi:hypothetical protein